MSEDKDKLWLEDELQREILMSAEEQPVPEALLPDAVVARLKEEQKTAKKKQGKKTSRYILHFTEIAAAIALVVTIGHVGTSMISKNEDMTGGSAESIGELAMDSATSDALGASDDLTKGGEDAATGSVAELAEPIDLKGYQVASDYREVYDLLEADDYWTYHKYFATDDGFTVDIAEMEPAMNGFDSADGVSAPDSMNGGAMQQTTPAAEGGHSTTNLQQEGVDESDIVKTDGNYIYMVVNGKTVEIVDIRGRKMELAASIVPELSETGGIRELYVDGNRLYAIGSRVTSGFHPDNGGNYWYSNVKTSTVMFAYDVTNRAEPRLLGTYEQDGWYDTSRKVGDFIYLFTRNYTYELNCDKVEDAIPYIQNKRVACEDIYISDSAYTELIMSSVDVNNLQESVDELVIFDDYSSIYVGNASIYLYKYVYREQLMTQITKFCYEDGRITPAASELVRGEVTDTFAISEKGGYLRVLTSDWSDGGRTNRLYMLDGQLAVCGKIEDIAEGESVYAARYIGDIAYFITYRNMDPLFVADLSDPEHPVLLGSVEISGFSDYLHLYEENLVLGIGYETDEYSLREGVKLAMFDVGDPANPTVAGSYVIADADYMTADSDYKSVLVDAKKGMIGFITASWDVCTYHMFTWTGEGFQECLREDLDGDEWNYWLGLQSRGLYAGDSFYLVTKGSVRSYSIPNAYAPIDVLQIPAR